MSRDETALTRIRVSQCDCNPGKAYASSQSFRQHLQTHRHEAFVLKERCRDLQRRLQAVEVRWKASTQTVNVLRRKCEALENALVHLESPDDDNDDDTFEDARTASEER